MYVGVRGEGERGERLKGERITTGRKIVQTKLGPKSFSVGLGSEMREIRRRVRIRNGGERTSDGGSCERERQCHT